QSSIHVVASLLLVVGGAFSSPAWAMDALPKKILNPGFEGRGAGQSALRLVRAPGGVAVATRRRFRAPVGPVVTVQYSIGPSHCFQTTASQKPRASRARSPQNVSSIGGRGNRG